MLAHAKDYSKRGFQVIPCNSDKSPKISINELLEAKKLSLNSLFKQADAMGIIAGKELVIIDLDFLKSKFDDKDSFDLCLRNLKSNFRVLTKGGAHVYYRANPKVPIPDNGDLEFRGVDAMHGARYVVCPPSIIEGYSYMWITEPKSIDDLPVFTAKEWKFLQRFKKKKAVKDAEKPSIASLMKAYEIEFNENSIYSRHISCPFPGHIDDHPSFRLSRKEDSIYFCTCGPFNQAGNYISFVAMMEGWLEPGESYKGKTEIVRKVFDKLGIYEIEVPGEDFEELRVEEAILKMNKEFFFLSSGNGAIYKERLDGSRNAYTVKGFKDAYANMEHVKEWLESPLRRSYERIVMEPGGGCHDYDYNEFKGFPIVGKEGVNIEPILKHIRDIICGGRFSESEWLLDWIAHIFQKPDEKPRTAIVLYSHQEGAGKGFIVRMLSLLLGKYILETSDHNFASGRFRGEIRDKLLIIGDEAVWGGQKSILGALKQFVTEPEMVIEEKFTPRMRINSYHRLLITTNELWTVPIGQTDRRWTFFESSGEKVGDANYFNSLFDLLNKEGAIEALMYYFETRKIKNNVCAPLETKLKRAAKATDLSPFGAWWVDCIYLGLIDNVLTRGQWEGEEEEHRKFNVQTLFQSWAEYCKEKHNRLLKPDSTIGFSIHFKKLCVFEQERSKLERQIVLPTLENCRKMFSKVYKFDSWEAFLDGKNAKNKVIDIDSKK